MNARLHSCLSTALAFGLLTILGFRLEAQNTAAAGQTPTAAPAPVSKATIAQTPLQQLQRLLPDSAAMKHVEFGGNPRQERAAHLFVRYGDKPDIREAAVWFLQKYVAERQPPDFYAAAGLAIVRLYGQAKTDGLTDEEKAALQQVVGNNPQPIGRIDTVAEMVLLEDRLRGLSDEEKLPEYEKLLKRNDPNGRHAFLIARHFQVPPSLLYHWKGGPRFQVTGQPSFEGTAGQWYWRYRDMKFVSPEAEMQFLFGRIQECYAYKALKPTLPPVLEGYRYDEAFAATARLIEMGDVVVPFLLKQEEFIMTAYGAEEGHDRTGFNFELEVMRANRNAAFKPLLLRLVRSANKNTHYWAALTLDAIQRDAPSNWVAHYIFEFDAPVGF